MLKPLGAVIAAVKKGSLADQAGLERGDILVAVDGERPRDYIDYRYLTAAESINLLVSRPPAGDFSAHIQKHTDEDLGLRFTSDVFDGIRTCRCHCQFCFVSQLPPGLRPALYVRDDDYRLSFLHGNFITLSNLREADFQRILRQHLSPLWISVHTTEPQLRAGLMGSSKLPDIRSQMRRLAEGGIELHAQVVVCPDWNDGPGLEMTVKELAVLHPGLRSVAIVPAGINEFLAGKSDLRSVNAVLAREIIQRVETWQQEFLPRLGTRLAWPSDEMYLTAGLGFPPAETYEDFAQRGNGVGEARLFLEEVDSAAVGKKLQTLRGKPRQIIFATGVAASGLVACLAAKCNAVGLRTSVVVAANRLLGPSVTSAALIPGRDWLQALGESPTLHSYGDGAVAGADLVLLPRPALNAEGRFLDNMSRQAFAARLGTPVAFAPGPLAAVAMIARRFQHEP